MKDDNQCFNKEIQDKILEHEFAFQEEYWKGMETMLESVPAIATATITKSWYQKLWHPFLPTTIVIIGVIGGIVGWNQVSSYEKAIATNTMMNTTSRLSTENAIPFLTEEKKTKATQESSSEFLIGKETVTSIISNKEENAIYEPIIPTKPASSLDFFSDKEINTHQKTPNSKKTKLVTTTNSPHEQVKIVEKSIITTHQPDTVSLRPNLAISTTTQYNKVADTKQKSMVDKTLTTITPQYTYFAIHKETGIESTISKKTMEHKEVNQVLQTKLTQDNITLPNILSINNQLVDLPSPTATILKKLPKRVEKKTAFGVLWSTKSYQPFSNALLPKFRHFGLGDLGIWGAVKLTDKTALSLQVNLSHNPSQGLHKVATEHIVSANSFETALSADITDSVVTTIMVDKMTYLQVPILLKTNLRNAKEQLLVGGSFNWLLNNKGTLKKDTWLTFGGVSTQEKDFTNDSSQEFVNQFDISFLVGYQRIIRPKWILDVRYQQGLKNVLKLKDADLKYFNSDLQIGLFYRVW